MKLCILEEHFQHSVGQGGKDVYQRIDFLAKTAQLQPRAEFDRTKSMYGASIPDFPETIKHIEEKGTQCSD